jgi:hypothetical protein
VASSEPLHVLYTCFAPGAHLFPFWGGKACCTFDRTHQMMVVQIDDDKE